MAKYRIISFYGFDIVKFMKINVYRNIKNKKAKYENIVSYHESFPMKKMGGRRSKNEININIYLFLKLFNIWRREENGIDKNKGKNRK